MPINAVVVPLDVEEIKATSNPNGGFLEFRTDDRVTLAKDKKIC